jgi:hypothetical protein
LANPEKQITEKATKADSGKVIYFLGKLRPYFKKTGYPV